MAMFDFSMKAAVVENTLKGPMKGGLYENLIAGMLSQKNKLTSSPFWYRQSSQVGTNGHLHWYRQETEPAPHSKSP